MKRSDLIDIIQSMRDAAQEVVDKWSEGDLASAVNNLEDSIEQADKAIAWWMDDELA